MREPNIIRQQTRIAFVKDVVIQMREKRTSWPEVCNDGQSLFETEMGRVRFYADAVQYQNVKIAKAVR